MSKKFPQIPNLDDEASYSTLYAAGNVEYRGVQAVLTKSPYLRRLQMVKYFGDLPQVLETTYEQHVIGTSEIMKNYAVAFFDLQLLYHQKLLLQALNKSDKDNKASDEVIKFLHVLRKSYAERISRVASVSSLIGMLAAPPFRKPFGSSVKRLYIKTLTEILLTGNKLNLKRIHELYIGLYSTFFGPENGNVVFIEPINGLFEDNMIKEEKKLVEQRFKERYMNTLRFFYSKRIIGEGSQIDLLNTYSPSYSKQVIAHFLLRFRTLSSLLGLGYSTTRILEALYNALPSRKQSSSEDAENKNIRNIRNILSNLEDSVITLLEAMLINHSASILGLYEIKKLKISSNNSRNTEEYLVVMPIGSYDTIVCFTSADPTSSSETCKELRNAIERKVVKCKDNEKCFEVYDLALENRKVELKKINIINKPLASFYEDFPIPCCVLGVNRPSKNDLVINVFKRIDKYLSIVLATDMIIQLFTNSIALTVNNEENKSNQSINWILKEISEYGEPIRVPSWSQLFLRYFMVNMIQSDMIPSAFQLDLLNRLSKDVKMGWQTDYDDFSEIVFNLENYAYLTYSILSSIYTSLFSDLSVLSYRTAMMKRGDEITQIDLRIGRIGKRDCSITLRKTVEYSISYYTILSNEYRRIANRIEEIIRKIETEKEKYDNIISIEKSITRLEDFSKKLKDLLKETSNLIDEITYQIIIDLCGNNIKVKAEKAKLINEFFSKLAEKYTSPNTGKIDIRDIKFTSLVDFLVKPLLSLSPTSSYKREKKQTQIQINGMINLVEILLRNKKLSQQLPNKYNDLSYKTLLILQSTLGASLNKALTEKIKANCSNYVTPVTAIVHVPIQGVFKPNFHLPYPIPSFPKLAITGLMDKYKEHCISQNSKNPVERVLCIYSRHQETESWIKNYPDIQIGEILGKLEDKPLSVDGETIIVPDTGLWNTVGSSDILSEEISYHENRGSYIQVTKTPYHLSFIIYSVIFELTPNENETSISIATLQNCVINSISDLIADFF